MPESPERQASRDSEEAEDLQRIFRRVFFRSRLGQRALAHMMRFCRFFEQTYHDDPRLAERESGQRDMILMILDHAGLIGDYEALSRLMARMPFRKPDPAQDAADETQLGGDAIC